MFQKLKTVLYHGTISEIAHVDVKLGRGRKDMIWWWDRQQMMIRPCV